MSAPVTAATDWALAAIAAYWASRTRRAWPACAAAIAMLGLGAMLGGAWHAMHEALPAPAARGLWQATAWSLGLTGFLLLCGSAVRLLRGAPRTAVVAAATIELACYLAWTASHAEFVWTGLHLGATIMVALILHVLRDPDPRVLGGMATALVAGAVQQSDLRVGPHVGPNDLYHIVAMVAVVLLGSGAERVARRGA